MRKTILFVPLAVAMLTFSISAGLADEGDGKVVSRTTLRREVQRRLGKETDYYAMRYTYVRPYGSGGTGKGAGLGTYLKLYDVKGQYVGTISQGYDGKYHPPTWLKMTGTLSKEDIATAQQRLIAGTDLPDIVLKIKREETTRQPAFVFKAQMAAMKKRLENALGKEWDVEQGTVSVRPESYPGRPRPYSFSIIHRALRKKIPATKRESPPVLVFVATPSPQLLKETFRDMQAHGQMWRAASDSIGYNFNMIGMSHLSAEKARNFRGRVCDVLDAHWGPTVNGLRMRAVGSRGGVIAGMLIPFASMEIQNCTNQSIVLQPDGNSSTPWTLRENGKQLLAHDSPSIKTKYSRKVLRPGQIGAFHYVPSNWKRPAGEKRSMYTHISNVAVALRLRTVALKKGEDWKTIKFSKKTTPLHSPPRILK
jgi:hypothetical protein